MRNALLILAVSCLPGLSMAQQPNGSSAALQPPAKVSPGQDLSPSQKIERGWFFFEKKAAEEVKEPTPATTPPPPASKEDAPKKDIDDLCKKAGTWTKSCGFVDPGTDYDFQAKQRDALLVGMSMSQNDPKAVEEFQYYMRWVMGRASEVANLWQFNMIQNPELDPSAKQPISTVGLRMMTDVKKGQSKEIFKIIKEEGGMVVFFTKSDCEFCHAMAPSMSRISAAMQIPVRNASLDSKCLPSFLEGCLAGEDVQAPAQALQVTTVPTAFLYVKPNTWIRIATGITDDETMKSRIFSFYSAYRNALLKGVNNSLKGRPSVDFSFEDSVDGSSKGTSKVDVGSSVGPSEADVAQMLGKR
jgi:hypothetical protein